MQRTESPRALVARLDAAATHRVTAYAAGRMVWRRWGAGRPLVLFHGATGSWLHWVRNIPALAGGFEVVVPDLPGYGESDTPPEPHTAEGAADILAAGLDTVVPPPRTLAMAGFSFGGILAGLVAARLGARVHTLILIGPNGMALAPPTLPPLRRPEPHMSDREIADVHRENLQTLMLGEAGVADDLAVHVQTENVRRARFKSGGIPQSDALLRALPHVQARLASIWGARDAFIGPHLDARRRLLERFQPGLDFHVIPGAGHWVPYEAAEAVNAAMGEILDGGR